MPNSTAAVAAAPLGSTTMATKVAIAMAHLKSINFPYL